MFDDFQNPNTSLDADSAFDLLQELGKNTAEEVRQQRAHFRLAIKISVVLQAGNSSEMLKFKVQGVTGDISQGGCSGLFPIPVGVGDIFRLQFDKSSFALPLTFARCVRCRLVREDAFEAGFAFFKPICLPENVQTEQESGILS